MHTLGSGADDYMTKPASMHELVARVEPTCGAPDRALGATGEAIEVPGLRVDPTQPARGLQLAGDGDGPDRETPG